MFLKPRQLTTILLLFGLLFISATLKAENDEVLDKKIQLPPKKDTVYRLLEGVSDLSGFLFVYDETVIDNDSRRQVKGGNYTIREAIFAITGEKNLTLKVIGKHIFIEKSPECHTPSSSEENYITIEGVVFDKYNNSPLPFTSIGISEHAIGTITNQNGEFRFRFPDSLHNAKFQISHLGYESYETDGSSLMGDYQSIYLEPKIVSIQEVVVRLSDPKKLLHDMLNKRLSNYPNEPIYQTTFYREGIMQRKQLVSLTEAVFKVYKKPFFEELRDDQVKLLKMRNIKNRKEQDTLITKLKSGILACLMLDVIKNPPDFLNPKKFMYYNYTHSDIRVIGDQMINVITFEQKEQVKTPLFKGEIYISQTSSALIGVRFEINPLYIEKTTETFVAKKSRKLQITPTEITYDISYKYWDGIYYINHIRGDLHFRVRKKGNIFNKNLHTWFEMVTEKTETERVTPFPRNETLPIRTILSEQRFTYDEEFWENFNIIPPEESLQEAIKKISFILEKTEL